MNSTVGKVILEARGLSKEYVTKAGSLSVFSGMDFIIREGEFVGIVGQSGVGKSTLLHILGCLDRASSGQLSLDGKSVGQLPEREMTRIRNRAFGFVFQFHYLLPEFTSLENVMMPALVAGKSRKEAAKDAHAILCEMEVEDRGHHYPAQLSGGEQQRMAIARALINQPRVLFLDEPTGNLDTKTGWKVFELLQRRQEQLGVSTVLVTHNAQLSRHCHRVLEMSDGSLVEL
jgi:lipoprotein-releasing system ATP-binding protein